VRDRWGVPHITARSEADLFFAQGFVQAQDRLFQMDLWRRSSQGRLSEVLGSNFIARDAMTRRVQYRGDPDAEWESYGPDVRAIAIAFTRGINAWVRHVAAALPEEFALAGWAPELWAPEDLLSRTDAFVASGDAEDEVFRARLAVAVGRSRAHALLQPGERAGATPAGLALDVVSPVVGDAVRRVGTSPFFMSLAVPPVAPRGSNAWALSAGRTETGAPLLAADPHAPLDNPSLRYVIHLRAPGWNVVGATAPWLPGVVIGHNERLAWGLTLAPADTQDVYVEQLNPANSQQVRSVRRFVDIEVVRESIPVRGGEPFEVDHQFTRNGFVIATDTERHLLFTLRWSGAQPGTAGELAGAMLGRAQSEGQLRQALSRWKLPVAEFVYADVDGTIGRQVAGLMPVRREADGRLPLPGWDGRYTCRRSHPLRECEPGEARPHSRSPRRRVSGERRRSEEAAAGHRRLERSAARAAPRALARPPP
jgi:penicillin amidase